MGKYYKWAVALVAPLMLTGCLFLPGKFDATLRLMQGGGYQFTYIGEMQVLAGDAKEMSPPTMEPFDPENARCQEWIDADGTQSREIFYDKYGAGDAADEAAAAAGEAAEALAESMMDSEVATEAVGDDTAGYDDAYPTAVERTCTAAELAELEQQEIAEFEARKKEYDQRSGMMATMFGGAIPGNDEALEKFAETLRKYEGWEKVEYVGNNLFNVEYRISGNFDQYFAFPVLNDASMQYPFFQIVPRKTGELEILAPGISGGPGGMLGLAMLADMPGSQGGDKMPIKPIEGRFTLETNGEVLGNNSPDGYISEGNMKTMRWDVKDLSASPRALIKVR